METTNTYRFLGSKTRRDFGEVLFYLNMAQSRGDGFSFLPCRIFRNFREDCTAVETGVREPSTGPSLLRARYSWLVSGVKG